MKYGYGKININPQKATFAIGFEATKQKFIETKSDLDMRLLRLIDDESDVTLITIDSLTISYDNYLKFKEVVHKFWPHTELNISASHTHYAPSLVNMFPLYENNVPYLELVLKKLSTLIKSIKMKNIDGQLDYHYSCFNDLGRSRISTIKEETVYAGVLTIFNNNVRVGSLLLYNCHPTIDKENVPYFSSDYVGQTLQTLEAKYPNEFFMFFQGACGDISTRYVRKEKTFNEVIRLSKLLTNCFEKLMAKANPSYPLYLTFKKEVYTFPYTFKNIPDIDPDYLNSLNPKEVVELEAGMELAKLFSLIPNKPVEQTIQISALNLGKYRLMFSPFELFSEYNNLINRRNELLIGYTNGAGSYMTPINSKVITYEYFLEIITDSVKELIFERLTNM